MLSLYMGYSQYDSGSGFSGGLVSGSATTVRFTCFVYVAGTL